MLVRVHQRRHHELQRLVHEHVCYLPRPPHRLLLRNQVLDESQSFCLQSLQLAVQVELTSRPEVQVLDVTDFGLHLLLQPSDHFECGVMAVMIALVSLGVHLLHLRLCFFTVLAFVFADVQPEALREVLLDDRLRADGRRWTHIVVRILLIDK